MQKTPPAMTLMPNQSRLINAAEGYRLEMISGCLWLTRPDDSCDYFLVAGMSMPLNERLVLIQSDKLPNGLSPLAAHYRLVPVKTSSDIRRAFFSIGWKVRLETLIARVAPILGT
jgi:hypothetical protein